MLLSSKFDSELESVQSINIFLTELVSNLVSLSGILGSIINGLLLCGKAVAVYSTEIATYFTLTANSVKIITNGSRVLGPVAIVANLLLLGYNIHYYNKKESDYAKTFKETTDDIEYIKIEYERITVMADQRVGDLKKTFKKNLKK